MIRSRMNAADHQAAAVPKARRRRSVGALAVLCASIACVPTAVGQDGVVKLLGDGAFTADVQQRETARQRISVTVGTSTAVDTSAPVKRAEVANPEVAEIQVLSPTQLLVTGNSVGATQIILWDESDHRLMFSVVVELNLEQLRAAIMATAPDADVEVYAIRETVILRGQVPDLDTATRIDQLARVIAGENVEDQMSVAGEQQVLLRCTIAEVDKRATRQLGINGWLAGDNIRDVFVVNQISGINPADFGVGASGNIIAPGGLPFITPGVPLSPTAELTFGFPRAQMQVFMRALRRNSLLRILAEPNLVSLSGHEASFLAGGEFPIPVSQGVGGAVTVEFREYGVRLNFLPTVIGRQMIRLKVAPEVSELDTSVAVQVGGFVVPGVTERRAETTIELASGSTIAIAGLLREQLQGLVEAVPGLGEIPVLGQLFRSEEYQRQLTELVIMVTPEIVGAMTPDQVPAAPGSELTIPNDWQFFGLGMIQGEPMPEDDDYARATETSVPPRYRTYSSSPGQMSLHGPWGPAEPWEIVE